MKEAPVLLVQCCHLPHFFYVAARLRERHPGIRLDALLNDHPQARFYSRVFPLFENTFFGSSDSPGRPCYDQVILPLLTPGYRKIKQSALLVGATPVESDFEANLRPLSRLNLLRSTFQVIYSPTPGFREYIATFPHRPRGEKVLLVRSCSASWFERLAPQVKQFLPEPCELTQVEPSPARRIWRGLKNEKFDSAFVFFTGEKGFSFLKLLPFLLRVPRTLVFNENGDRFYASKRSLVAFFFKRAWYGRAMSYLPSSLLPARYILLIQTADDELTLKALLKIRDPKVAGPASIAVFCREDKKALFEGQDVARVYTYEPSRKWQALKTFRSMRRLNLEVVAALLTGEPIFRPQKLLFFLLPTDNRLVFNRNLDCFYFHRSRLLSLLMRDARHTGRWFREFPVFRPIGKGLLFFPRFLFLVIWVTTQKLRRAYSASSEVK
jgi:hypothetical protein